MVCILLEVRAGWASLTGPMQRTDLEAAAFLADNWGRMRSIWTWSLVGNGILAVAALLLMQRSTTVFTGLAWAVYFLGNLLLILCFALSLGSYPPAFAVLAEQPHLFEVARGAPLVLFELGALFGFSVFPLYFGQALREHGRVSRGEAAFVLLLIIGTFATILLGYLSITVFALSCFLVPFLLGLAYFRRGGAVAAHSVP